ncbi:MAG TPA: glycoside hydrolase family 2, partial [Isosphaeraceae bacterium]|nr:glycoside hydrolase family 2 [Isosphaeraceae bacterium]
PDIWLRRSFDLPKIPDEIELRLFMHHDENVEVYLNGVLASRSSGFSTDYRLVRMTPEARAALKPGENVLAVHCHQTSGGQYIDVGIAKIVPEPSAR